MVEKLFATINNIVLLPGVFITFTFLVYVVLFLWKNDPEIAKAKLFLRYNTFRRGFTVLAIMTVVLIFHVLLIFIEPYAGENVMIISNLQKLLGFILSVLLAVFSYMIYRTVR